MREHGVLVVRMVSMIYHCNLSFQGVNWMGAVSMGMQFTRAMLTAALFGAVGGITGRFAG